MRRFNEVAKRESDIAAFKCSQIFSSIKRKTGLGSKVKAFTSISAKENKTFLSPKKMWGAFTTTEILNKQIIKWKQAMEKRCKYSINN